MEIIKFPSPNFGRRKSGTKIEFIVLHYTAIGKEASLDRLCNPIHEVSCHYLIDQKGVCYQLVDDSKRAWHAGKSFWRGLQDINSRSLGIELVNSGDEAYPKTQMESLMILLQDLLAIHKISPQNVLGHSDIAPSRKTDPGKWFDWRLLSENGLAIFPKVSLPIDTDKQSFLLDAQRAGFEPEATFEQILQAFRSRCRANFEGVFDGYDCALMKEFADIFDVDELSNPQ